MSGLSLYEFTKHIFRNAFVAFLMSVMCLVGVVTVGLVVYEYQLYAPFKELSKRFDKGVYVPSIELQPDGSTSVDGLIATEDEYRVNMYAVECDDYQSAVILGYSEWIWKNWEPRLIVGDWFSKDEDYGDECIDAVVGGNTTGISVGDVIGGKQVDVSIDNGVETVVETPIGFRIIGIVRDDSKVMGTWTYNIDYKSYETAYSLNRADTLYIFAQDESMAAHGFKINYPTQWAVVEYRDDITREQIDKNAEKIRAAGSPSVYEYKDFMKYSKERITRQLLMYVPLCTISFLMVCVVLLCIARINVNTEVYNHSVYYLIGVSRRKCIAITVLSNLLTVIASVVMFFMEHLYFADYALKNNIHYNPDRYQFMTAAGIYVLMVLLIIVMHVKAFGKTGPMEALRNSRRAI